MVLGLFPILVPIKQDVEPCSSALPGVVSLFVAGLPPLVFLHPSTGAKKCQALDDVRL